MGFRSTLSPRRSKRHARATHPLYRLRVLGSVTLQGLADPLASTRVTQPRHLALVCYLALARPRGLQPRDRLIDLLWPDHDTVHGRQALRNALHGVRQRLGADALVSPGDQLVGLNDPLFACDAWDLERGLPGELAPAADGIVEPMEGLYVTRAPDFDRWLDSERARLCALMERVRTNAAVSPAVTPARQPYATDAWVLHARGHYLFLRNAHGGSAQDLLRARDCFERALTLDPACAPALAGLSNFYAVAARREVLTPFSEHFAEAIRLSRQTLAIDPTLAVPHVHFGVQALYLDHDFRRAGVEFETATQKDPSYAEGHRFYGVWLGLAGRRADALEHMERAVALEPDVAHFLSSLGAARLAVGDRRGAEEALRRTLAFDAGHLPARTRLIRLLEEDGRYQAAVEERERAPALADAGAFRAALERGLSAYEAHLADALRLEIDSIEARLIEDAPESVAEIFSPPCVRLVDLYLRLGDTQRARRWAREMRARRPHLAPWLSPFDLGP